MVGLGDRDWHNELSWGDPFIGCKDSYKLSLPLLQVLNNCNIYTLAQAAVTGDTGTCQQWMDSNQLGFTATLGTEWDNFVSVLRSSNIHLTIDNDKLVWSWNRATGTVTAKLAYHSILFFNKLEEKKWWYKAIWSLNIPIKIICFMWMCLKDCILTGVNYQKRGGIGPLVCNLCLKNEETTTHLFVECQKTQNIWSKVIKTLRIDSDWKCTTIEENLRHWFFKLPKLRHIPFLVFWGIWKFRNKIMFENLNRFDPMINIKIILSFKEYSVKEDEDKLDLILNPIYFDDNPIGFFDGAAAENMCGIGIFLKLSYRHTVKAHFTGGTGNNMKV
jgi:hypothetical protein